MGMFDGITDAISGATSAIGGMIDPVQGLVSGGLSLLGGTATNKNNWDIANAANATNAAIANSTNQFNADQAQKNRDFQERMRQTQYQTTVQDLMAAGLNPMLAYSQGGAGTPSGSAATGVSATTHAPQMSNAIGSAVQAYQSAKQNQADIVLKAEQAKSTNAQAEATRLQGLLSAAQTIKTAEEAKIPPHEINRLIKTLDVLQSQIVQNRAAASASSAQAAKTNQETDLGIVSSNPVTQAWGEIKRGASKFSSAWTPKFESFNNAIKAKQQGSKK